jgi:hypothetical protein
VLPAHLHVQAMVQMDLHLRTTDSKMYSAEMLHFPSYLESESLVLFVLWDSASPCLLGLADLLELLQYLVPEVQLWQAADSMTRCLEEAIHLEWCSLRKSRHQKLKLRKTKELCRVTTNEQREILTI